MVAMHWSRNKISLAFLYVPPFEASVHSSSIEHGGVPRDLYDQTFDPRAISSSVISTPFRPTLIGEYSTPRRLSQVGDSP